METYVELSNFFKKEMLMLLSVMSVTLMSSVFERQRKGNCQGIVEEKRKDHRFGQGKGKCMFSSMALQHFHLKFFF
ncbi:hypothetical protein ACSBR1_011388 [Camellia fascicularis]